MNIRLTPKDTFRDNKQAASAHSDVMASKAFKDAVSTALLEYQFRMASAEPQVAAVTSFRLKGAQEFISILLNLGEPDPIRQPIHGPGLIPPEEISIQQTI